MNDDPDFFAWLDGELEPAAAARMEAKVAADPELSAFAEQHRRLAATLRTHFDPIAAAPLPPELERKLRGAEVIDFAAARERKRPGRSWGVQASALAASLALGLLVGGQWLGREAGPIATDDGGMVAAAGLDRALDTQLASAPTAGGPRVGLTFRDRSGAWCRSFSDQGASGVACREAGRWQIRALLGPAEGQGSDYRMAAGQDPRLMDLVEESMAGDPLGPAEEQALVAGNWR
jgi:hypothetical protein